MPTYNITLRGHVQDVGLRDLIAELGQRRSRRGLVFNEADGSVRILVSGARDRVDEFVEEIEDRSTELSASIESVEIESVDGEVALPPFVNPPTDDLADINRKLGKGVRNLSSIDGNVSRMQGSVSNVEEGVSNIEGSVSNVEEGVSNIGGSVSNVEEGVSNIEGSVSNVEDDLSSVRTNTEQLIETGNRLVDGQERMIDLLDERL